jgi:predicted DNA binding CopG/RHH family protein
MGCNISMRKADTGIEGRRTTSNGLKSLFYATTEFDLSASENDDDEDEILSIQSIKDNSTQENLTKKTIQFSSGLTTTNVNTSTANNTLLDDRLKQTSV